MKPTDLFNADELEIIDEAIIEASRMGMPEDRGLGFIGIIMAVVSAAVQIAQNKIKQTKAIQAQAEAMKMQASQMKLQAEQQKKMNDDIAAARAKTAAMMVKTQDMTAQQAAPAGMQYVDDQGQVIEQPAEESGGAVAPLAVAGAATALYFLLKR
jgi:type II secretory pathway pseudopilin PulG